MQRPLLPSHPILPGLERHHNKAAGDGQWELTKEGELAQSPCHRGPKFAAHPRTGHLYGSPLGLFQAAKASTQTGAT